MSTLGALTNAVTGAAAGAAGAVKGAASSAADTATRSSIERALDVMELAAMASLARAGTTQVTIGAEIGLPGMSLSVSLTFDAPEESVLKAVGGALDVA